MSDPNRRTEQRPTRTSQALIIQTGLVGGMELFLVC